MNKLILIAVIFTVALVSCKKDDAPKPSCRIITATPDASAAGYLTYNFSYNSEGKLSSSTIGTSTNTFAYSGSTVVETSTTGGVFSYKNIITLNANGMASNIRTENDETGTNWSNQALEYNGTELIKSTSTNSSGGAATISAITWSGGNMITVTSGSSTSTIEYYTDKPAQTGDYLSLAQLAAGYEIYRTKNAIKSILAGSDISNFNYTFDADGKITSVAIVGTSIVTYTYQFQCN